MPDPGALLKIAFAFEASRALHAAVELGLFDALSRRDRSSAQLARARRTEARATMLICNALVAIGLLRKRAGLYGLTALSRAFLVRGTPRYLGDFLLFGARRWPDWERLADAVRIGQPARVTDYFADESQELEQLLKGMHDLAYGRGDAPIVARRVDLSGCKTLLDVGAGPGSYALELCRRNPLLTATLFDRAAALQVARSYVRRAGLQGRVRLRSGDYRRDDLGGPYDAALLFNILHGEEERTNLALLRRLRRALHPGGLLVIKDHVLDEELTAPADGALFSLVMLLFTRGRSYARSEIRGWLRRAGFAHPRELRPEPPMTSSILIATRP